VFVGNDLVGFNFGAFVGPMTGSNTAKVGQQIIDNNVFDGAVTAIRAGTLQQIHGENIAVAPTTLFDLGNRASAGKISATAAPTNIITRTDASFPVRTAVVLISLCSFPILAVAMRTWQCSRLEIECPAKLFAEATQV
jgi:hypothetical protein